MQKQIIIALPADWASALINGDYSGLDFHAPKDAALCRATIAKIGFGLPLDVQSCGLERDFDGATRLLSNYTFALPNLKNRLPKKYTACLPFSGFYDSLWSSVSDREIENMAEWEAFEKQNEVGTPSELRLAESDFTQALNGCFDYAKFKRDMSAAYVDVFKDYLENEFGVVADIEFEALDSPREYNFTTDRIFVKLDRVSLARIYKAARKLGNFDETIKKRHTSYDGFASYCTNDVDCWKIKKPSEFDHNEIETLFQAILANCDDWELDLYYGLPDAGADIVSDCIDRLAYELKLSALRFEKIENQKAFDPGYVAPILRCPNTADLFAGNCQT